MRPGRAVEAKELLDGVRQHVRPLEQQRQLVRVGEQRHDGVAEEVGSRLVAGEQQQERRRDEFSLRQLAALVPGGDQRAEQVLRGVCPLAGDEPAEVVSQRLLGVLNGRPVLLRATPGRAAGPDHVGQLEEPRALRGRHPQQLADHGHWEWQGEVVHQVG